MSLSKRGGFFVALTDLATVLILLASGTLFAGLALGVLWWVALVTCSTLMGAKC